jgi:hypothetical protein
MLASAGLLVDELANLCFCFTCRGLAAKPAVSLSIADMIASRNIARNAEIA